jgi:hypothetical protein
MVFAPSRTSLPENDERARPERKYDFCVDSQSQVADLALELAYLKTP